MTCLRTQTLNLILLADPDAKAAALGALPDDLNIAPDLQFSEPSGVPGRLSRPVLLAPSDMPNRSVGSLEGRCALLHALAHIERNAMDLALDVVWRFAGMPTAFYQDWWQVAREEALHFKLLHAHLQSLGVRYGDLPAHDGLWEMAAKTRSDVLARMALVPRTLEARGLDASPAVRNKLISVGDIRGAEIIDVILRDEIGHVAIGNHWFRYLCQQRGLDTLSTYARLAKQYGAPRLKAPFNLPARRAAGFDEAELALLGS